MWKEKTGKEVGIDGRKILKLSWRNGVWSCRMYWTSSGQEKVAGIVNIVMSFWIPHKARMFFAIWVSSSRDTTQCSFVENNWGWNNELSFWFETSNLIIFLYFKNTFLSENLKYVDSAHLIQVPAYSFLKWKQYKQLNSLGAELHIAKWMEWRSSL